MTLSTDDKRKVYSFLPEHYIAEPPFLDGQYKPPGKSHANNAEWWSEMDDGFLFFALHDDYIQLDLKTIKKMGIVTGTKLDPADDDYPEDQQTALSDALTGHVSSDTLKKIMDGSWAGNPEARIAGASAEESISSDELWVESERISHPVMLLKNRKSKSTTSDVVAVWNARLASEWGAGAWIRVDMRHHPNEKLAKDGVLIVHVDHRNEGGSWAKFESGASLTIEKNEKALYGLEDIDYPCLELLQLKATKKIREAMSESPGATDEYEQVYWEETFPRDLYSDTNIHAQLGGWPLTWPEESADEQMGKHLILRTYANSEPWVEVFRKGQKYEVIERIT